jgi:hypothetical protein
VPQPTAPPAACPQLWCEDANLIMLTYKVLFKRRKILGFCAIRDFFGLLNRYKILIAVLQRKTVYEYSSVVTLVLREQCDESYKRVNRTVVRTECVVH